MFKFTEKHLCLLPEKHLSNFATTACMKHVKTFEMIFMNLVVVTFTKICQAILIFIYIRVLTTTLPKTFYLLTISHI